MFSKHARAAIHLTDETLDGLLLQTGSIKRAVDIALNSLADLGFLFNQ